MLIESHDVAFTEDRVALKRLLCEYSHDELKKLLKLRIADGARGCYSNVPQDGDNA